MPSTKNTLGIENSMDLLLVLLYSPGKSGEIGEHIDGITKLQKLMFLLQQDKYGPKELVQYAKSLNYEPYKMGPYSSKLHGDIDALTSVGFINTERLFYLITDDGEFGESVDDELDIPENRIKKIESKRFFLSSEGDKIAKELWLNLPQKQRKTLTDFKGFFNSLTLRQLLMFVYDKFPRYIDKSIIRKQLGF